jgi:UDP-N-acetylglucosamine 2-epimerase (non-hydrolysing)
MGIAEKSKDLNGGKIKVVSIFGTRPEAIKMAPVVLALKEYPQYIDSVVAVTAQHREMLDQVLKLFSIIPKYDLDIMSKGQTLFDITSRALNGLNDVLKKEKFLARWIEYKTREATIW